MGCAYLGKVIINLPAFIYVRVSFVSVSSTTSQIIIFMYMYALQLVQILSFLVITKRPQLGAETYDEYPFSTIPFVEK